MRFRGLAWTASLVVLLGWMGTSRAESEGGTKVYIALFGGLQTYGMSDVNDGIREGNKEVEGSGFVVDEIRKGAGFGGGIRVWPSSRLSLSFDYMRLAAGTSSDGLIVGVPVAFKFELPASAIMATAGYLRSWRSVRYGLGAGGGYYICKGKIESRAGTERISFDVKGKGLGFHALAMADVRVSSLRFETAIGYRLAKTAGLKADGVEILADDGSKVKADWNGILTRFGISIPFDPGPYPAAGR